MRRKQPRRPPACPTRPKITTHLRVPNYSGRTTGTTCRTGGTTPLQIYLNRPGPFGTNRLAYGPLEHIERFRMMGGWPMGVRFMGHTTCPHVRAVANTDHGLCGASKVVKTATDGPCGVAARGCAASGAMATHGTMQTNDVALHASYHSNRI